MTSWSNTLARGVDGQEPPRMRFETQSITEMSAYLNVFDRGAAFSFDDPGQFVAYHRRVLSVADVLLSLSSIDAVGSYSLQFCAPGSFCLSIPIMREALVLRPGFNPLAADGQAVLMMPGQRIKRAWDCSSTVMTMHLPASCFDADAALLKRAAPMMFAAAKMAPLVELIMLAFGQSAVGQSALVTPVVAASFAPTLVSLLHQLLPQRLGLLPPPQVGAPYYIVRAERHMHDALTRPFDLEALIAAAGVGARTLQYGFKKYHGIGPRAFFKQLRLEAARARIIADPKVNLSDVGWDLGYQSTSHFSEDYRVMFGEPPSATARRARWAEPTDL